mgnify:FL=1
MNYIKINGRVVDVNVAISDYEENINVLDGPNAGRSSGVGRMIRDVLGCCIGHKVTVFRRGNDYKGYDEFWNYLKAHSVDDSVQLEAADGQTTIAYQAYYTSASHSIERVENGINYWGEISVNFIPMYPQITP